MFFKVDESSIARTNREYDSKHGQFELINSCGEISREMADLQHEKPDQTE
jgi:hypothetical protein